jgi:hypothetical protein
VNIQKKDLKIIISWIVEDPLDVEKARNFFKKYTEQGWLAVKDNGKMTRILHFEPRSGKIFFIPLSEGG